MKLLLRTALCTFLLLSALLLASCGKTEQPNDTATTPAPSDTTVTTTAEPAHVLNIVEDGATEFVIYQPKSLGDLSLAAVPRLVAAIRAETGASVKIVTDWGDTGQKEGAADLPAILIGDTSFAASDVLNDLKNTQFIIQVTGNQLVIGGKDDAGTVSAIDAFIDWFVTGKGKTISISEDQSILDLGDYPEDSYLSCLGEPIENYRIVIPADADIAVQRCAVSVADHLTKLTGCVYEILTDDVATDSGAYEILIGKTSRTTVTPDEYSYEIVASGKTLQICADSWYAYEDAIDVFTGDIVYLRKPADIAEGARYSKHLTSELEKTSPSLLSRDGEVRVLIHNIWGNTSEGQIADRMRQTAILYEGYAPDVIGLQECSPGSRGGNNSIIKLLGEIGYTEVPAQSTNSAKNNYTPLLYNPETVKLIDYGYRLYEGQNDSGSKGLTWGVFETVKTGETFAVLSTHYWWQSDDAQDTLDRESNARESLDTIAQIQAKYNCPVILGGDFNCNPSSGPYAILTAGGLKDVQANTTQTENSHTHHTYPTYNEKTGLWDDPIYPASNYARSIDHIFSTKDNITIKRFDVVTDLYALLSSDHCPLIVDFDLN